jgi:hypothetical protein
LRDLGDHGQAEAIRLLEKNLSPQREALAVLQDALNQPHPGAGERDPFRFDRILIAN